MPRAVLKDGMLLPIDPLPEEWSDGRELRIEDAQERPPDEAEDLDRWYHELEALVAQNDPKEVEAFQSFLAEIRQQDRELARRKAGLP